MSKSFTLEPVLETPDSDLDPELERRGQENSLHSTRPTFLNLSGDRDIKRNEGSSTGIKRLPRPG